MSLLWNRVAVRRSSVARGLFRTSIPSLHTTLIPPRLAFASHYHQYSQSQSSIDATMRKIRRLDKRASVDKEAVKKVLSPEQEALRKLGIVNVKLRSSTAARSDKERKQQPASTPPPSLYVKVRSVHAAQTFDVVKILSKVFAPTSELVRHYFGRHSLIVQLKPSSPGEPFRFVAVYRFGSVVFFNMTTQEAGKLLESIKKYGTKSIAAGFERRENYGVVVQPQLSQMDLENEEVVTGDYCVVESLDMNSVSVIASIMSQTVALDSYNDIAEELLGIFASINSHVKQTGKLTEMEKNGLFRVVAQNNAIFIDMISKLGIKERSDTAWNLSQYDQVSTAASYEMIDYIFKLQYEQNNSQTIHSLVLVRYTRE